MQNIIKMFKYQDLIQSINLDFMGVFKPNIQLDILRLDLLHPIINGNKWCKLFKYLEEIDHSKVKALVSCGGVYSNHLHVLGYVSFLLKIECYVIVRESLVNSEMQNDLHKWNVNIINCSREDYRNRYLSSWWDIYLDRYKIDRSLSCIIPEGGSGLKAVYGTCEFFKNILGDNTYDEILLPLGTGGTYAGVVAAAPSATVVTGVSVIKKVDSQRSSIQNWLSLLEQS
jgi:1-aminocyclopropane-1-carboxylate deaminase